MSYRVRCSACGKVMTLEDDAAGETLVCVACGTRLEAPPPPTEGLADAQAAEGGDRADMAEAVEALAAQAGTPSGARKVRPVGAADSSRSRTVLLAIAGCGLVVIVIAVLLTAWIATGGPGRWSRGSAADNLRNNADLLALKSEAETLAIQGKLPEAHEKYRRLQQLWATRDIQNGLMWDIMERAKVDQDKIYMMLLNRMAPAVPVAPPGAVLQDGTVVPGGPAPDAAAPSADANGPENSVPTGGYPSRYVDPDAGNTVREPAEPSDADAASPNAQSAAASSAGSDAPPVARPGDSQPATRKAQQRPGATAVAASQSALPTNVVSDAEVGESLKRGIDYLIPHFKEGLLEQQRGLSPSRQAGLDALCVYALLTSGQAMKDPRLDIRGDFMKQCLEKLKTLNMRSEPNGAQQHLTYARSLRAAALAVYNRPEDHKVLKEDVDWLVAAAVDGAYTYDERFTKGSAQAEPELREPRAAGLVPSPLYSGERVRARGPVVVSQPLLAFARPLAPGLSFGSAGKGAGSLAFADGWYGDHGGADVIPIDGMHDPRTGREITPWTPMTGARSITVPNTPPPPPYPRRTRPPGRSAPETYGGWRDLPNSSGGGAGGGGAGGSGAGGGGGPSGGYGAGRFPWDNSNSQYGLLGVWSGAEVGIEVPVRYWKDVEAHWTNCQLPTGEWTYRAKEANGTLAMTCGGLASLFVTHDWLSAPMVKDSTGRPPLTRAMARGLAWMEGGDNAVMTPNNQTHYFGYDLYGLERVGLASGFKYFGVHDWYRELAAKAVSVQAPSGAWGRAEDGSDTLIDTAYTLLFLSRGRHPILMNKLQWDKSDVALVNGQPAPGYWANRPRDVANLTRFASRQLERGLNWQVVSLDVEASDWLDAPVLYIASHQAPGLSDEDYQKLRQFVEMGGLIFTHADAGAGAFNRWVPKLVEKVYPGHKLEDLPEGHFVYNLLYKIKSPRPQLQAVGNGSRLLLVHSPTDLSAAWQQRGDKMYGDRFRVGVNLFLYAAGKGPLRNRLSSPYVPEAVAEPEGTVPVARLKYGGNWDPEPGAWPRFRRLMEWQTRVSVEHPPVELKDLKYDAQGQSGHPVAHLTGTAAYAFADAEVAAAKAFVEAGGILVVDPCGGSQPFLDSVRTLLGKAFPGAKPSRIPADHPLLRGAEKGEPLALRPRPYVAEAAQAGAADLQLVGAGKGFVVVSPLDLTSGLLGTNTWGIRGYEADSATQLMRNVLLLARKPAE